MDCFVNRNTSFDNGTGLFYCNQTDSLSTLTTSNGAVTALTYISFTVICALVVLGVFGNIFILAITLKFQKDLKGHDILVIALAVCDSATLVMTAPNHPSVYEIIGTDIRAITTAGCKLYLGVWQSLGITSSAIIVLVSIERFITVWFPLRYRYIISRQTILRYLSVSVPVIFLIYMTLCILYCEVQDGLCYPNLDGSVYSTVLRQMPDSTAYSVFIALPLLTVVVILSTLMPLTISKLLKRMAVIRRRLNTEDNHGGGQSRISTAEDNSSVGRSCILATEDIRSGGQSRIPTTEDSHSGGHSCMPVTEKKFRITVSLTAVVIAYMLLVGLPGIGAGATGLAGINIHHVRILHSSMIYAFLINHSINFILYNCLDKVFRKKAVRLFGTMLTKDTAQNVAIDLPELLPLAKRNDI